jgi:hypothetical protein
MSWSSDTNSSFAVCTHKNTRVKFKRRFEVLERRIYLIKTIMEVDMKKILEEELYSKIIRKES